MQRSATLIAVVLFLVAPLKAMELRPDLIDPDFDAYVACQMTLEDLKWSHRLWPKENPDPKPARAAVLPDAAIQARVWNQLRMESALKDLYGVSLDTKALQDEMDRMALNSRAPERLIEMFAALGNDPKRIAECLARPQLVERLLRERYARDPRWHGELRTKAEGWLAAPGDAESLRRSGGDETTVVLVLDETADNPHVASTRAVAAEIALNAAEFRRERRRLQAGDGERGVTAGRRTATDNGKPTLLEAIDAFVAEELLDATDQRIEIRSRVWAKLAFDAWWTIERSKLAKVSVVRATGPFVLPVLKIRRPDHSKTSADTWANNQSTIGAPSARSAHTVIWTGTEMLIWGGAVNIPFYPGFNNSGVLSNGSRYDPALDSWMAMSNSGAPSPRGDYSAVWTGSEMIVWGGYLGPDQPLNTGGRYNPASDAWLHVNVTGAPSPRYHHPAVWTGTQMIVWGGWAGVQGGALATGGRYSPTSDSWLATSQNGAPTARFGHAAVWTGTQMIIWGGPTNTGGRYNPVSDDWTPTSTLGAPNPEQSLAVVWTGSEMIVPSGGTIAGGRYDPLSDSWNTTSTVGAPPYRFGASAIWTGEEVVVWGGATNYQPDTLPNFVTVNTGGRYRPNTDSWLPITQAGAPSARIEHGAVWTGTQMMVWGGWSGTTSVSTMGAYFPYDPDPTATTITADLPDPSMIGASVPVMVSVTGASRVPTSGRVTVTASTGETCTDLTLANGAGNSVTFSCDLVFSDAGPRTLLAVFSDSVSHLDSTSASEPHEAFGLPTLSVSDVALTEGDAGSTSFAFTVTRSHTISAVSFQAATANGSATAGADYTALMAHTFDMPAGGLASTTLTVTVTGDTDVEIDETFRVLLSNQVGATITDGEATGIIVNDDTPILTVSDVAVAEGDSGVTTLDVMVALSNKVDGGLSVPVSTLNGTAHSGSDFFPLAPGTLLQFVGTAGEVATLPILVFGDAIVEGDESFAVVLGTPGASGIPKTTTDVTGTATILNDDSASVGISFVALPEGDSGFSNFIFTVSLSGGVQGGFSVPFQTLDGNAQAGSDYTGATGTLTFSGGVGQTRSIAIAVQGDTQPESDEVFYVDLGTPSRADVVASPSRGTGVILNDDMFADGFEGN